MIVLSKKQAEKEIAKYNEKKNKKKENIFTNGKVFFHNKNKKKNKTIIFAYPFIWLKGLFLLAWIVFGAIFALIFILPFKAGKKD